MGNYWFKWKINFALYFPIDTANIGSDRRSLYDVLTRAMKNGKITEVYTDSYFNTKSLLKIFRLHWPYWHYGCR
jgi:hypothetical protein